MYCLHHVSLPSSTRREQNWATHKLRRTYITVSFGVDRSQATNYTDDENKHTGKPNKEGWERSFANHTAGVPTLCCIGTKQETQEGKPIIIGIGKTEQGKPIIIGAKLMRNSGNQLETNQGNALGSQERKNLLFVHHTPHRETKRGHPVMLEAKTKQGKTS